MYQRKQRGKKREREKEGQIRYERMYWGSPKREELCSLSESNNKFHMPMYFSTSKPTNIIFINFQNSSLSEVSLFLYEITQCREIMDYTHHTEIISFIIIVTSSNIRSIFPDYFCFRSHATNYCHVMKSIFVRTPCL